jgi:site-specific recombinase XerD
VPNPAQPVSPTRDDVAAFRAYLEGIDPHEVVARYCAQHPQRHQGALRVIAAIRKRLVAAARARKLDEAAQLLRTAQPRRLSASTAQRVRSILLQLPDMRVPAPKLTDPPAHWLAARSARALVAAGITTLAALALRRAHRRGWWRKVPGLGQRAARSIDKFFATHPQLLEDARRTREMDDSRGEGAARTSIVAWESFRAPRKIDGSRGKLRAPRRACLLDANNDYEAVQAWLALQESAATQRAYRKEAERLILWAVLEKSKPLSSLITEDAIAYRYFLRHPTPTSRWIGPSALRRSHEWKPFQKGLSVRSAAYALSVLSALYRWLTEQRYLIGNPFAGVTAKAIKSVKGGGASKTEFAAPSERAFTAHEWAHLLHWAEKAEKGLGWSNDAAKRLRFVLRFAQATGLRIHELVAARVRDVRIERKQERWLMVRGKGNKRAAVALPPAAWQALVEEMRRRGYGMRLSAWANHLPLIAAFGTAESEGGDADKAISSGRLWAILRKFFDQVADQLDDAQPRLAAKLHAATPHWVRHTHASHALAAGVELTVVRDNLRHASVTTTSGYLHVDGVRRSRQLGRAFSGNQRSARAPNAVR